MTNKDIKENRKNALKAVDKINQEMAKKYGDSHPMVGVMFADHYIFFDMSIPNSIIELKLNDDAEDDRLYNYKDDSYEDYYSYIKRKFNLLKEKINSFNL